MVAPLRLPGARGRARARRPAHRRFPGGRGAVRTRLPRGHPRRPRRVDGARPPGVRAGDPLGRRGHNGAAGWMLRGRLFQQALTEAIWAVTIGRAARLLGDPVPELTAGLAEAARVARDSLVADGRFRSNYTAWLDAAGAACTGKPE